MSDPVTALNGAVFTKGIAEVHELPPQGMITLRGGGVAWMSPDELLLLCPYAQVPDRLAVLQSALASDHALAVNVSDARAMFAVSGPQARDVLAKLAPVDLSPAAFTPGMIRRTRLAQVAAAFWMVDEQTFHIVCFRSVGQYVFDLLKAAAQPGSEVAFHR